MKTVLISATFYSIAFDSLIHILEQLLDKDKLRPRYRIIGEEINYEDDLFEIYIYSLESPKKEKGIDDYLFDTEYKGSLKDAEAFIQKLINELLAANIKYQFEYNEAIDEEGVGEEYVLEHPQLRANV